MSLFFIAWFNLQSTLLRSKEQRTNKYCTQALLHQTTNASIFCGTWCGPSNRHVCHGSRVIIKRYLRSIDANVEINVLRKLMHKNNPIQDFFAKLVCVQDVQSNVESDHENSHTDLVLQHGGTDLFTFYEGKFNFDEIVDLTQQVKQLSYIMSNAVQCILKLHMLGCVHNDIKPENIVVSRNLEVKLIDFGISCPITLVRNYDHHVMNGEKMGSEFYMHPFLLWDRPLYLPYNDWWGLAQTCFTLYTGLVPYDPQTTSSAHKDFILQAFLYDQKWDAKFDIHERLREHTSFPYFCDFVRVLCSLVQNQSQHFHSQPQPPFISLTSSPDMLVLQHPFLCYWNS